MKLKSSCRFSTLYYSEYSLSLGLFSVNFVDVCLQIATLSRVKGLFPGNPFAAGFGNKEWDMTVYKGHSKYIG